MAEANDFPRCRSMSVESHDSTSPSDGSNDSNYTTAVSNDSGFISLRQDAKCLECKDLELDGDAKEYCHDCPAYLCSSCATRHKKVRSSKSHLIMPLSECNRDMMKMNMRPANCKRHLGEQLKFHCWECSEDICNICYPTLHNGHKVGDFDQLAKKYKEELDGMVQRAGKFLEEHGNKIQKIQKDVVDLEGQASSQIQLIMDRGEEEKRLIDSRTKHLVGEMKEFERERTKAFERWKEEIEKDMERIQLEMNKVLNVIEKGSSYYIASHAATKLKEMGDLLVKKQDDLRKGEVSRGYAKFTTGDISQLHPKLEEIENIVLEGMSHCANFI